jgi:hypothetical protein
VTVILVLLFPCARTTWQQHYSHPRW